MNGTNGKKYLPKEICTYLKTEKMDKKMQERFRREGFRCLGTGERGMGGLSRTAKFIPESIHIIISPMACQRHCDFDLKMNGYTEGIYSIFLTEKEIVGGRVAQILEDEIYRILETSSPRPKVITITVTCVDCLIHTDYKRLEKKLKEQFGIRFGVVEMFPIMSENKVKHTDLFPHMVYSLIKANPEKPKKKLINLLGKIEKADQNTDFYTLLNREGYTVREIRQCQTLDEFDEMGEACLNIVLSEFHLHAAKMMEKKYHVPYFFWNQHMNYETIKSNYMELEKILGCKLEFELFYQQAKAKAEQVQRLSEGKTFAVGQRIDYIPVKAACDLVRIGLDVISVFVDKIDKADLHYYEWLQEHRPDMNIYLAPDISMRAYMNEPESVDIAMGGIIALKNVGNLQTLNLPEEPYDFVTYSQVMDHMIEQLQKKTKKVDAQAEQNPFGRQWKVYPKGVV